MRCEKCGIEHDGSYGSGRFCSAKCARSFSSSVNKDLKNLKISESAKRNFNYITYNGAQITTDKYAKILAGKKVKEAREADRRELAIEIGLADSPYKDFDTVYKKCKSAERDCYYFTKHGEDGSIIERAIVPEYRYIIERQFGRRLQFNEVVHHIDGNHFNNQINNLLVVSRKIHNQLHSGKISLEVILAEGLYISN